MPEGLERGCASRSEKIWFTRRGGGKEAKVVGSAAIDSKAQKQLVGLPSGSKGRGWDSWSQKLGCGNCRGGWGVGFVVAAQHVIFLYLGLVTGGQGKKWSQENCMIKVQTPSLAIQCSVYP